MISSLFPLVLSLVIVAPRFYWQRSGFGECVGVWPTLTRRLASQFLAAGVPGTDSAAALRDLNRIQTHNVGRMGPACTGTKATRYGFGNVPGDELRGCQWPGPGRQGCTKTRSWTTSIEGRMLALRVVLRERKEVASARAWCPFEPPSSH